jgi:hypothetical protein
MNATENVEISKGVSLLAIWLLAVVGNLLSIVIVSRYKLRRIPDILVVSLACTDLVGTAFPIPVSTFLYFSGESTLDDNCALCQAYAVVAQFTRYSAALLVTLMLVDRCVWILRPIRYHHGVFRPFFCVSVVIMWLMAAALSLVSLGSHIDAGENTCLFRMNTWYGVVIAVFGGVQFLTVFVCFCIIIVEVAKLARRRRKMVVNRGKSCAYTLSGKTKIADKDKASIQENGEVKSETNENSKSSSSCGQKMKQLVKCMKEKIHPSAEQQFAIMFSAIVVLFYISWLPIIVSCVCDVFISNIDCLYVLTSYVVWRVYSGST